MPAGRACASVAGEPPREVVSDYVRPCKTKPIRMAKHAATAKRRTMPGPRLESRKFWFAASGMMPRRVAQNSRSPDGTSYLSTVQDCFTSKPPRHALPPAEEGCTKPLLYLTHVAPLFGM